MNKSPKRSPGLGEPLRQSIRRRRVGPGRRAFSLLEVLVAVAVFSILLFVLLAITSGTTNLTNLARRNIDAASEIRATMDRLTTDLQNAVVDPAAPFFLSDNGTNHELHFLSRVDGYNGQRPLAVVRYRLRPADTNAETGRRVMERAAEGVDLDQPSLVNASPDAGGNEFDHLAGGVFRFHIAFLDRDGQPVAPGSNGAVPSRQVAALVVSLAAIDDRAASLAPEADWSGVLPGGDFAQWAERLRSLDFSDLPPEAARGIQIRRRVIPISGAGF